MKRKGSEPVMRKPKTEKTSLLKTTKIQLRLRRDQKELLARAAKMRQTSLSNFMLEHAYEAARAVLAEQIDILMPPAEWEAFCKALDAPPQRIPALSKLFAEPSLFNEQRKGTAR
jgi:uncharacterized protein (DUF1778 family)